MRVHRVDPFVERDAFGFCLVVVAAFHLEYEVRAVREADEKIRAVFVDDALEDIDDLKAEVIVLRPRGDVRAALDVERLARLPR